MPDQSQESRPSISRHPVDRQVDWIFVAPVESVAHAGLEIERGAQAHRGCPIGNQKASQRGPAPGLAGREIICAAAQKQPPDRQPETQLGNVHGRIGQPAVARAIHRILPSRAGRGFQTIPQLAPHLELQPRGQEPAVILVLLNSVGQRYRLDHVLETIVKSIHDHCPVPRHAPLKGSLEGLGRLRLQRRSGGIGKPAIVIELLECAGIAEGPAVNQLVNRARGRLKDG